MDALLSLSIDLLRDCIGLVAALLPLRDLTDALFDDFGGRDSDVLSVVSEGRKHRCVELLLPKEFIEGNHSLLAAELAKDKQGGVLLDVSRARIRVFLEPEDGHVEALVDHLIRDLASSLSQVPKALGALLNQLAVVDPQLVQHHGDKLVDVVHDLGFAGNVENLIQGEKDAELLFVLARVQLLQELLKDSVGLLRVLL